MSPKLCLGSERRQRKDFQELWSSFPSSRPCSICLLELGPWSAPTAGSWRPLVELPSSRAQGVKLSCTAEWSVKRGTGKRRVGTKAPVPRFRVDVCRSRLLSQGEARLMSVSSQQGPSGLFIGRQVLPPKTHEDLPLLWSCTLFFFWCVGIHFATSPSWFLFSVAFLK